MIKEYVLNWLYRLLDLPLDSFDLEDDTNDIIEE